MDTRIASSSSDSADTPVSRVASLLFAAEAPLSLAQLQESAELSAEAVRQALETLAEQVPALGLALVRTAGGWRLQVDELHTPWVHRLYRTRASVRLTRAQLETLAIIAHRQPVTRGEIEQIRGVTVASGVLQALQGYGWIETRGWREAPGRPALWVTTERLLTDLGLESLTQLQAAIDAFLKQVEDEARQDGEG